MSKNNDSNAPSLVKTPYTKTHFKTDKVKDKTHHFLGEAMTKRQIENGTHPSQKKWTCEVCGKIGKHRAAYTRFHGAKCKWGEKNG
jgi:hypothetical protein